MPSGLAQSWLTSVSQPQIAAALESIYAQAAAAIEARKPVCTASGRCCHFEAHGHRLYVTGLEAAYTLSRLPTAPGGTGVPPVSTASTSSPPALSLPIIQAACAAGTCPYLSGTLCTVHTIKPLACRTYYCDPTAQEWQHELTERLLGELRALHDRHNIEYRYGEWRDMLSHFTP
jgi:Fe-S-cluster containining protein